MTRPMTIVGAPSSIGIRPYDDGGVRRLDQAPGALREQGLTRRLSARDAGDVLPPPYLDLVRPPGRPRNEQGVGRGDTPLARLGGDEPLASPANVVLVGRRDDADAPWYGQDALRSSPLLDLPHAVVREQGPAAIARTVLERLDRPGLGGFWIHVDADVLDPVALPAVDSPEPGGLEIEELAELLVPLVRHPRALGLELTIYDPALDPDRTSAARLVALLERAFGQQSP